MNGLFLPKGPKAVLLLHAYTGTPNDVRMLARKLEKEGYTVLAPLFMGHGTMDPRDILSQNPLEWWQDARNAMQFLIDKGYQEIATFGLSLGGIFATKLMEEYQDVIVGGGSFSSPVFPSENHNIFPNFLAYCEIIFNRKGLSQEEVELELKKLTDPLLTQLSLINDVTKDVYHGLDKIDCPVFLAQSAQDEMIEASHVYRIAEKLAHLDHETHWYAKSTHVLTVSKDRHQFEQDMIYFLSKLAWDVTE